VFAMLVLGLGACSNTIDTVPAGNHGVVFRVR
jgi:hypothetical protein